MPPSGPSAPFCSYSARSPDPARQLCKRRPRFGRGAFDSQSCHALLLRAQLLRTLPGPPPTTCPQLGLCLGCEPGTAAGFALFDRLGQRLPGEHRLTVAAQEATGRTLPPAPTFQRRPRHPRRPDDPGQRRPPPGTTPGRPCEPRVRLAALRRSIGPAREPWPLALLVGVGVEHGDAGDGIDRQTIDRRGTADRFGVGAVVEAESFGLVLADVTKYRAIRLTSRGRHGRSASGSSRPQSRTGCIGNRCLFQVSYMPRSAQRGRPGPEIRQSVPDPKQRHMSHE
jgi:hypothetical protein